MWKKTGHIYMPDGAHYWNRSHASVPTIDLIDETRLRIYFGTRDDNSRNHISFIDVNPENPQEILYVHDKPVLGPGKMGMYDDCGSMPSWLVNRENGEKWMYYIGWNVRNTISYHNAVGLAISRDGGYTFERFAEGPLFDRTPIEPYYSACPCVLYDNGIWRMYYLSCTQWVTYNDHPEPYYHIKYAESEDGINWKRDGHVAIDFEHENECGIVRSSVIKCSDDLYKMWYSYRRLQDYRDDKASSYRIGYAESSDGRHWTRMDAKSGIQPSESGWDSLMTEYPGVYLYNNKLNMIYNGNTFGKTGFGHAVFEGDWNVRAI